MAAVLPLRPHGMGVEIADLRETATNAARAKNRVMRNTMAPQRLINVTDQAFDSQLFHQVHKPLHGSGSFDTHSYRPRKTGIKLSHAAASLTQIFLVIGPVIITTDSINAYILHNTTTGVTTGGITKTYNCSGYLILQNNHKQNFPNRRSFD